ncbi:LysR family transcriptional regulator [Streptococcus cristatus]|uniref:Transcriptional regulator, LysR family n=1 Tax=Streptococcus cristatus TaxID=45634 RepID=A0A139N4F7_STRCR|nr:LysR family transcriptional regulator [Streptococcus cristatus]KXT70918.1 transcriptional regulator, LysR family [Streptococcus cristatus]
MNYAEIETFLTAVELKSISAAAKKLYISQGTASHRIQNLEADLEIQLFFRQPGQKQLVLTKSGEEFLSLAKQWKSLYQETHHLKFQQHLTHLSVAGIESVNTFALLPFYKDFALQHPEIKLKLSTYHSNEIYELLNKGAIDLGFTYAYANYPTVQVEALFTEPMVLVTQQTSVLPEVLSLRELDPGKEIYINWGVDFEIWHREQFPSSAEQWITAGNCHMQLSLLDFTDSWAFLPLSVAKQLDPNHYRQVDFIEDPLQKTCYCLTPASLLPDKEAVLGILLEDMKQFLSVRGF